MGELLALLTALLHAIGVVLYKRSIAFVSPFGLNLFKNCVALVFCVSTAVFLGTTKFLSISPTDLALMLVSGAIGIGISDMLFFMTLVSERAYDPTQDSCGVYGVRGRNARSLLVRIVV